MAAQQRPFEPKRRLLGFDESDEILDEEDELDAKLSRLFIIVCLQVQNIASSGRGQVEAKEATISKILEAGEKNTSALQPPALRRKEF